MSGLDFPTLLQVVRMVELLRTFWDVWSISENRGDWEVAGVEWLLVKFMTGNFSSEYF